MRPHAYGVALIVVVGLLIQLGAPGFVSALVQLDQGDSAPTGETGAADKSTDESEDSATLHEVLRTVRAYDRVVSGSPKPADGSGFGAAVYRPPMSA